MLFQDNRVIQTSYFPWSFSATLCIMAVAQEKSTVLCYMQTCRALNTVGVRILLRFAINLRDYDELASFCSFILTNLHSRSRWIRQLELSVGWDDEPFTEEIDDILYMLAEVLESAIGLQDLNIHEMETLLELAPEISKTFNCRGSLLDLAISGYGDACEEALESLDKSKLKRIHLQLQSIYDLSWLLANFEDSLEELHANGPVELDGTDFTMPRVIKLVLEHVELSSLSVSLLIRSFPNLKFLDLVAEAINSYQPYWAEQRSLNLGEFHNGGWAHLSRVRGSALTLYVLGLRAHIERLDVISIDRKTLHYLPDVLRDMQPTHLSLGMKDIESELRVVASSEFLNVPLDTYPTHLDCDIHIYGLEAGMQDPNKIIDGLLTIGATLHAEYFTALVNHEQVNEPFVPIKPIDYKALDLIVASKTYSRGAKSSSKRMINEHGE